MSIIKDILAGSGKGLLDGVGGIISKLKADPTKVLEAETELEKLKLTHEAEMKKLDNQLESEFTKQQEVVNATMQAEAKSDKWPQYMWRPIVGFTFCAILINNYILVPYLKKYGVEIITIPDTVFTAILVILGAASAGRGLEKFQKAKK